VPLEIPFDAFVTLFVFLVGVPAVVLQTLPAETRQLVAKRAGTLALDAGVPFAGALGVVAVGIGLAEMGLLQAEATLTVVLGLLLAIGILSALRIARRYGRPEAVVKLLEREALREVEGRGRVGEDTLHDLVEYGRQCEPGRGRDWVLETLRAVAARVIADDRYTGDRLEDLISGVVEIVTSGSAPANARHLATAATVLRDTMRALDRARDETFKQADTLHAIHAVSRLGPSALGVESEASALRLVQALGLTGTRHPTTSVAASQALYELGIEAIARDEVLIAISALGHLTTLVEAQAPAEGEIVADTLGLLAHFHTDGATGRDFASERLARLAPSLRAELLPALDATVQHCAHRTLFRTADRVRRMRDAVAAGRGAGV
jgi:hypothetical protein